MPYDKNVTTTSELKERVRDYAWSQRTSMGAVVAKVIDDYAEGELELPDDVRPETLDAEIKYVAPDSYERALARAKEDGVALSDVIRFGLKQRVSD